MNATQLFSSFCNFIDKQIFSDDNIGTSVPFVVDHALINDFCKKNNVNERELMSSVRYSLYSYSRNISHIKGILAIQLYAASKRANSEGITSKNYRDRLSQVLDWDINDLQHWMTDHQEMYWETFYSWCDTNYFIVPKCKRKEGAGRYVQYPLMQSLCVFTEEDLKYIAGAFVKNDLQPGEDIAEYDFWKIIGKYEVIRCFSTRHSREVLSNSRTEDDYLKQIFNYYLRWNGEYKTGFNSQVKKEATTIDDFLYLDEAFSQLQIRNSKLELQSYHNILNLNYTTAKGFFHFKHQGLILFKKDDVYEGMWQESRYLENGEEGVALVFNAQCSHPLTRKMDLLVKKHQHVSIYNVTESLATCDLYTKKRYFSLEGGLKIGRATYLYGAGPTLEITKKSKFWLDGKPNEMSSSQERFDLSSLSKGVHTIKFPNFKTIELQITSHRFLMPIWKDNFNKWTLDKEAEQWKSEKVDNGIVGLDFSAIPQEVNSLKGSVLGRWAQQHHLGIVQSNETNIAVNVLSNIQ